MSKLLDLLAGLVCAYIGLTFCAEAWAGGDALWALAWFCVFWCGAKVMIGILE